MSLFQELILISLGKRDCFSRKLTDKDWTSIYTEAQRQSLAGVLLTGVERVIASDESKPNFLMQWIAQTLTLENRNRLLNARCKDITDIFNGIGLRSCVLKGQGVALLYPNPLRRQCGDIDLWVEGNRDEIYKTLKARWKVGETVIHHADVEILKKTIIMIYKAIKRIFDFVCAFLGIVGTSPIWILSIILTELSDPGPLFYFANRVGKDNKKFKMWKFRSMRVARGANEASLRPDQDRIFWWGKIMRRLKIDELPQLMNILNGTMSIVGPRPAAVDQVDITRGGANAIAATVPCGLTSQSSLWDYIYGDQFPEEEEYNEKVLPIRLKLDVYYVKHASFFGDIKLILWTVLAILYTACGKYPQWIHNKLVEYSKTV